MRIKRVQVDEGFLAGLDIAFHSGLNVIVGPRGAGKTSIIELIRFCLDAQSFTDEAGRRGRQQALSILGSGRVVVTLEADGRTFEVSRTAKDGAPRATAELPHATVLAQGEIEAVGAQAGGRIHLIDRLRHDRRDAPATARAALTNLHSMTRELRSVLKDLDTTGEQLELMAGVEDQLEEARAAEAAVLATVEATQEDRDSLRNLEVLSRQLSAVRSVLSASREELADFAQRVDSLARRDVLAAEVPDSAGDDPIVDERERVAAVQQILRQAHAELGAIALALDAKLDTNTGSAQAVDDQARELRARLEQLQSGLGATSRRVTELAEKVGQADALAKRRSSLVERLAALQSQRRSAYRELDEMRNERFTSRSAIALDLTSELGPLIKVDVQKSAALGAYEAAIIGALRGSGLHYNTLAPLIADAMSPLELCEAIENLDAERLVDLVGLPLDRASAALSAFRNGEYEDVIAAAIDDGVSLYLLDGAKLKPSDELSIGQRCTVVLPILLARHGDILIVDQPEDHLDNSFIAKTVVASLREREPADQLIFASHNANIPVLGEADWVVHVDSDGHRGFSPHSGTLNEPDTVRVITAIMEGGVEAFEERARFYRRQLAEEA